MAKRKKEPTVRYVGAGVASEILGVGADSLRRWAKAGKLDFMLTPGGRYRYDIDGYLAKQGKSRAPAVAPNPGAVVGAMLPEATLAPDAMKKKSRNQSVTPRQEAGDKAVGRPVPPIATPTFEPDLSQLNLLEAIADARRGHVQTAAELVAALMAAPAKPTVRITEMEMPTLGISMRQRPVIEGLEHRDIE